MRAKTLVQIETINNIRLIGINRPEKKNCVNSRTADLLLEAFEEFDRDSSVNVAVLYGIGGTFCAGYDLEEASRADQKLMEKFKTRRPMGPSGMLTSKPTVAAVQGFAVAGGLELALWCDLRVMEETAVVGVYCRRFGIPLIDGGTVRLPKLIGLSRAMDLILTGRPVDAQEALQMGLANRVVSCGTGLGQAVDLAHRIARFPQECVKADRMSAYHSTFDAANMQEALDYEFEHGSKILDTESKTGAKRFLEGYGRHGSFNMVNPVKS
ncbi:uncharacterized protein LOC100904807 [Galendromus occidentalis]|uniref:Uncharacterized protein LOC100904807 n=1 Tax=Galendromus occidentalis TaxID=34638 RepID=A0AAJ6QTL3_9ACAR|nr:uncharacterized protein LOC100904807 [Galendromus occidentalis]